MDNQNRIFVGGIPVRVDKKEIVDFFSQYGRILHCKIKKNSKTGRSLGYAYLTFEDPQATKALINKQIEFFGRICECKQVFKKEELKDELLKEKGKKLLVYKLDPTVTNLELKTLFDSLTSISHAYVVKDPDSDLNLGYGYVVFHTKEEVDDFSRQNLVIMLKGKQVLYTNQSHLPPKKQPKLSHDSPSLFDNSHSRLSKIFDSEMSGSNDNSRRSLQGNSSRPSQCTPSHLNPRSPVTLLGQSKTPVLQAGKSSIVSDFFAEAGESCYFLGNSVTATHSHRRNLKGSLYPIQGQILGREASSNGKMDRTLADKDNTGYTQTTKISSNLGGFTQLSPNLLIKAKRAILADVLRACPYLNNHPDNYKLNYISKGRNLRPPEQHHISFSYFRLG